MTEPVQGVVKTVGVQRRSTMQERLRHLYGETSHHEEETDTDDLVDISAEARKKADGSYHKNILEHIEEDE